ncbi:aldose epimerase [Muricoccus radiodurans]|uniref:aldose epimerase family protein n=1 Tax=Muricoccus radiodurans TaxID=2231721 RepID=UPI003CF32E36
MLTLAGGAWRAVLLPDRGAALAVLEHDGRPVLAPLPEGANPNATWAGAFLMAPWTNRLDDGRLPYPGGEHRFPHNRVEERTALHGLSRERPWQVEEGGPDRAVLTQRIPADGQPFAYAARLEVRLAGGFHLALTVTNEGAEGMPFGTGWHPFFARPAGTRIDFRATGAMQKDGRNLPVGTMATEGIAGGEEAFSGRDTHYTGWDGTARIALGDAGYVMRAEEAWARNLQVFAPSGAGVICVEPVSHVPDVANRPEFAALGDMRRLRRGEALGGRVTLRPD